MIALGRRFVRLVLVLQHLSFSMYFLVAVVLGFGRARHACEAWSNYELALRCGRTLNFQVLLSFSCWLHRLFLQAAPFAFIVEVVEFQLLVVGSFEPRVSLTIQPLGIVRLTFQRLVLSETILLNISSSLWLDRAAWREQVCAPAVSINEFFLLDMDLWQLISIDALKIQRRKFIERMMLEPLLAGLRTFWVLDLVHSPQCLGRGRRYNLLLSCWLVESLDDAFGIFGPRLQSASLNLKHSFLRRVPLLVRLGIVLVLVSLGGLLVCKSPRYVLSAADR